MLYGSIVKVRLHPIALQYDCQALCQCSRYDSYTVQPTPFETNKGVGARPEYHYRSEPPLACDSYKVCTKQCLDINLVTWNWSSSDRASVMGHSVIKSCWRLSKKGEDRVEQIQQAQYLCLRIHSVKSTPVMEFRSECNWTFFLK